MRFANLLGLDEETFCKIIVTTKMFGMVNVLGHVAELHYEKYLKTQKINFDKAPTDEHYDYLINGNRHQVKRWETDSTDNLHVGVNLTKTHGNRNGADAFYRRTDFDSLVLFDVGFSQHLIINVNQIPLNGKYSDRLPSKFITNRNTLLSPFESEFLQSLKEKNENFEPAIEKLRQKHGLNYKQFLEKITNLTLDEIDSLFSIENFRLITGAKGFAAEEYLKIFLSNKGIPHTHVRFMYSKVDLQVKGKRVQVKTLYPRSTNGTNWAFKTHKTHGHGVGELYEKNAFDVVALFVGYNLGTGDDKYTPISTKNEFVFIPTSDLQEHPKHPGYLKRVSVIPRTKYPINDTEIF